MSAQASGPSKTATDKNDMEDLLAAIAAKLGPSFRAGLSATDKAKLDKVTARRNRRRGGA